MNITREYKRITLYGLVQGIGFRPHVVRLAQKWGIEGVVCNFGGGVRILASASIPQLGQESFPTVLDNFIEQLQTEPPPLSDIIHVKIEILDAIIFEQDLRDLELKELSGSSSFKIADSRDQDEGLVILPPDLPVCETCIAEMKDPNNRRYKHSLISCTHCGPRYSIIKAAPYDRCNTAMNRFDFCPDCLKEYTGVESRRFHAQTVSCHHCGPQLRLKFTEPAEGSSEDGQELAGEQALLKTAELIKNEGVAAVKGIGGYHFLASPFSDAAVKNLRDLKKREMKPFAVCFPSLEAIKAYAEVSPEEEALLVSKARPIVLLEQKQPPNGKSFTPLVLQNSRYIGAFLPYTPILVRLCDSLGPLVATSANLSDTPIINREADLECFSGPILSGILTHDRDIIVSQDDSVAWAVCNQSQLIRRARGYTPLPVYITPFESQNRLSVLALGGELKSTFCLQKGPFAYMSQYLGDLGSREALANYQENLIHMKSLMKTEPIMVACDLHPDYATTRLAEGMNLPVLKVQHHHAHIASVMAEKGLEGPILGVSFDGTGYGSDGTVWGGEFLIVSQSEFKRAACLKPIPLFSGDDSMKDCRKTAAAYLHHCGLSAAIDDSRYPIIRGALEKGINTIFSSSMGRLFDAVSSILRLCHWNRYEGEGAILLENAAWRAQKRGDSRPLAFDIIEKNDTFILDPEPLIQELTEMLIKEPKSDNLAEELALGFHQAVCAGIAGVMTRLRLQTGIREVALSGGVFQNRILTESAVKTLEGLGFKVWLPSLIPTNDGGISLGQAFIAMKKINQIG